MSIKHKRTQIYIYLPTYLVYINEIPSNDVLLHSSESTRLQKHYNVFATFLVVHFKSNLSCRSTLDVP